MASLIRVGLMACCDCQDSAGVFFTLIFLNSRTLLIFMADNLESKINSSFFRKTARNICLYVGAIALTITAGCAAHKSISKAEYPHSDNYYDLDKPTTPDLFKKDPDKPKEKIKRLPLVEVGLGLGEGNSYSHVGCKLSGILNIDKHCAVDTGISYGFAPIVLQDNMILGKFVANGSASFYYKITNEQSLFLRAFGGVQGINKIQDQYSNVIALENMIGCGVLLGGRFTSSGGVFLELGLGINLVFYPKEYHARYGTKGAFDLGIGFKFG